MKKTLAQKFVRAFVLLEVMLGVTIFAIGIIALGRCVNNCISAETARTDDQRARLALENRMAQIESGETLVDEEKTISLDGAFAGLTMKQARHPLNEKNENDEDLVGLYNVDLEVTWTSDGQPESKAVSFYILRAQ